MLILKTNKDLYSTLPRLFEEYLNDHQKQLLRQYYFIWFMRSTVKNMGDFFRALEDTGIDLEDAFTTLVHIMPKEKMANLLGEITGCLDDS